LQNQTQLLPQPEDLPDYDRAMNNLGRIPLLLYQGLEQAASKTATFRDLECPTERMDEGMAASLVRFHLLRYLKNLGVEAQVEEEWDLDSLPFMGIAFHYSGYHVKVLKGPKGCLPGCGLSEKKVRFYNQLPSMYLIENRAVQTTANLLVLWDFDSTYALAGVWLALPAAGGKRFSEVSAFWVNRIPHPSEGLAGIAAPTPPPNDDLNDLLVPIRNDRKVRQSNER